jgi:Family of unknown function (DUF6263)
MTFQRAGAALVAALAVGSLELASLREAHAQVKLEYKFPAGKKLTYKETKKSHQLLTIQGRDVTFDSEQSIVSLQTIGKRRDDGGLPIGFKVETFRVEMTVPGGITITYDSSHPDDKGDSPQLALVLDAYKLVSQIDFTFVLDRQNKAKAIEGTESFLDKAAKLDPNLGNGLRQLVQGGSLKTQFEQDYRNLPDGLVRKGEAWERSETTDVEGGHTFIYTKKYEYAGTEQKANRTLDVITSRWLDVKYSMDPDNPSPLKVVKSDVKIESSEGKLLFDREEGHIVDAHDKAHVKGSLTFKGPGQEVPGELDLTIEATTSFQPPAK